MSNILKHEYAVLFAISKIEQPVSAIDFINSYTELPALDTRKILESLVREKLLCMKYPNETIDMASLSVTRQGMLLLESTQ